MRLYHLTMIDPEASRDDYQEIFHIGVFLCVQEAEKTAKAYLASVPGFMDYPFYYTVTPKEAHGSFKQGDTVYWVQGWSLNENQDEVDIVESDDFACWTDAEAALINIKNRYERTEWTITHSVIGSCDWQEGFERVTC